MYFVFLESPLRIVDAESQTPTNLDADVRARALQIKLDQVENTNSILRKSLVATRRRKVILQGKLKCSKRQEAQLLKYLNTMFSKAQIQKIRGKKKVTWSAKDIAKSLAVASTSKKAYETIRDSWNLPLPNPRTLTRWTQDYKCKSGIFSEILHLMKVEGENMDEFNRLCVVNFDEMKINANVVFDKGLDMVQGPYNNAQVIMVNGLCRKWRQPIYYDFDQKITKKILHQIIFELRAVGFRVCAVVSDFGGTNRELWKELNVSSAKTFFPNPFEQGMNIWMFADAPHMLKLLRNHLLDDGWVLPDSTLVDRKMMEELLVFDHAEIKLCPKLKASILEVKGAERMKVAPAAKLFSHHTATLIRFCFPEKPEAAKFIQLIDDYFDIFNSKIPVDSDKKIRSAYGLALEKQDASLLEIETCISAIRTMFYSKKHGKFIPRHSMLPCQHGILASIASLKGLLSELRNTLNVSYIITRRLNQDPLESLFSVIRAAGRTNDHPSPTEFRTRMKNVLVGSKVKAPIGSNVEEDDVDAYYISTKLLEYVRSFKNISLEAVEVDDDDMLQTDTLHQLKNMDIKQKDVEEAAITYLAGYLAYVMKTKHGMNVGEITRRIEPPASDLGTENIRDSWLHALSRGGLLVPNEDTLSWTKSCDLSFCKYFPMDRIQKVPGLSQSIGNKLAKLHPEIHTKFVQEFVKIRLKIRINCINTWKNSKIRVPLSNMNSILPAKKKKLNSSSESRRNTKKSKQFL